MKSISTFVWRWHVWSRMTRVMVLLAGLLAARAEAVSVGIGLSHGQDTDDVSIGARWEWPGLVDQTYARVHALGRVELDLTDIQGERYAQRRDNVRALAAIPEIRVQTASEDFAPFVDLGLGLGGVSAVTINGDRHFASALQFTELLRIGLTSRRAGRLELALSAQHFSNAGLKKPNDGITYGGVVIAWRF